MAVLDKNDLLRLLVAERGPLLGFVYSLCRDRDLAEDVFQNLVVLTSEKQPTVSGREHFLSWARTAARYEVNNAMRKRHRTIPLDPEVIDLLERQWDEADRQQTGPALAEALGHCLDRLTPNVRRLVRLRYDQGLTGDALAAAMDRTLNAVHVALSRAYRTLAGCIEARVGATEGGRHG